MLFNKINTYKKKFNDDFFFYSRRMHCGEGKNADFL
jgi:hypothetical protein